MTALCLAAAAITVALPLQSFTLAWTHSIEKIRWEEDYRLVGDKLELIQARIRGSGAGMEPPEGAVFRNGVWHYTPALPALPRLKLTRSAYVADYELCAAGRCRSFGEVVGEAKDAPEVEVSVCGKE